MRMVQMWSIALALTITLPSSLWAQQVIRHPEPSEALGQRWSWALREAASNGCREGCWIGYSLAVEGSLYRSSDREDRVSLHELVYGENIASEEADRETALLFRLNSDSGAITEIDIRSLSQPARLNDGLLFWLGRAENEQSIALLEQFYEEVQSTELKEDLVTAVGVHDAPAFVVPFLGQVLTGSDATEVRESAAFWLGQQESSEALALLKQAVREDRSREVREKAVFAVSQMDRPAAMEVLIDLARNAEDREVREKAIFWLGQKASQKAVAALEDVAFSDAATEVQEKAVFALSRLPADQGIPRLIKIAQTHKNPEVREQAIFWLGQSGDSRAVDALVEIVRGQ